MAESLIEPFSQNKAAFSRASPALNPFERSANESFIEPNNENKPLYEAVEPSVRQDEEFKSMIEPPGENLPFLKKDVSGNVNPVDIS